MTADAGVRARSHAAPPASVRRKRFLLAVANHSVLIAASIAFLAPFVFITLTALMTNDQALSSRLWPHPFAWHNFVDVFTKAPLWRWTLNTLEYSVLATIGVILSSVPVAYALARLRWRGRRRRVPRRARRAHAAAAGDGRPAVRDVGEVPPVRLQLHRHALAGDHPELVRRRVLDLPAAPVLPDDSRGVHRRRARRRLRRAAHPHDRRLAPREAGDRRSRALLVPLHVQRLLPAAALHGRGRRTTGCCRSASRSSARSTRCSGT